MPRARSWCGCPARARRFEAQVGLDTNEQTIGGRGSVVFSVEVGGKEAFRSAVLREGMPPVSVNVDLGGATEFVLQVGDGGDGISLRSGRLGRGPDHPGRRPDRLAGRAADGRRADAGRSGRAVLLVHLRGRAVGATAQDLEGRADVEEARRRPDPADTSSTPTPRPACRALRGDRVPRFSHGGMDGVLQEHRHGRTRRSWRTSRPWTCGLPAATTASSSCTTRWAAPAR